MFRCLVAFDVKSTYVARFMYACVQLVQAFALSLYTSKESAGRDLNTLSLERKQCTDISITSCALAIACAVPTFA